MKDIKCKELLKLWKNVLMDTGILIAQLIKKVANFIWKSLVHIYNVTPWRRVHPYICLFVMLCVGLVWFAAYQEQKQEMNQIMLENDLLHNCIDSIQMDCEYNNIQVKAGEYAMHPHKQRSALTKDTLASLLIELDAWYPDIIMAQVEMESGFGVSELAKRTNNVVGMKQTTSRRTTQLKGKTDNTFGVYNNWESCVIDRVLWDHSVFGAHKPTRAQYINKLNNVYAYGSGVNGYGDTMNTNSKRFRDLF